MSLLTLIITLLLEQLHPLSSRKYLSAWLTNYAIFFQRHFNAGQRKQGKIAWLLAVLPLLVAVMAVFWLLCRVHPIVALAFNVLALYLTMGFRQFSHYFTDIHQALRNGNLDEARGLLSRWRGVPSHELNAEEVARVTIEQAMVASQRNVFGVIVWFVLFGMLGLGGAAGAMLYRLGYFLRAHWESENDSEELLMEPLAIRLSEQTTLAKSLVIAGHPSEPSAFGAFARQAFYMLEWLPVRLSAMTFAIVGDFENTIHCWRTQAASWPDPEEGILLASGAGALGVRLGMPIPQGGLPLDRPELGVGDEADPGFMQSAIGLMWRSVVCWMILLLLLTLANFLD
jgi:adenosylcobinamide-phosphate synthase